MPKSILVWAIWLTAVLSAAVPTPKEHFGFTPGDDYKLAGYAQISGYFQKLASGSDRIRIREFGRTSLGKPMYVAFISSPENLAKLERHREISRTLALGKAAPAEAGRLAAEGKAIVWIDSGLHASEVAPSQHAPELAWRMVTGESPEVRRIRANVILIQIPCINPDGLDMIVDWYSRNVGTPHETAPMPWLYQKYAGHDNNRDWFMLNLQETRNVTRLLFEEWFPQIVYNQHQSPAFPARIFVPPYAEPLNPHIPAAVMEGINLIGSAMKERFARENKPGILSYFGFDAWWNGGLRSVPAFHNMHGILTETAGFHYATPRTYHQRDFPDRFGNGIPTREPSVFYQRPWMGGKWGVRDAIEYMLTADFAILDLAATRPAHFLQKAYDLARASIDAGEKGKPYAYLLAPAQWDSSAAIEMLRRLSASGIEVRRARASFRANSKTYPEGTYVLTAAQPFRAYLVDLMEPQKYPEIRAGVTGPTKRPYDVAGWTLSMQMNAIVDRIEDRFEANLETLEELPAVKRSLDHRENASFLTLSELLDRGVEVRWASDGRILVQGESPAAEYSKAAFELRRPRVAVYEPWVANMDTGWTQFVLDSHNVPHSVLRNSEIRSGNMGAKFDTIILAAQSANSILHGVREGERPPARQDRGEVGEMPSQQRPEYTGGIGIAGLHQLENFVRSGGTLIALDTATELPIQYFPLPVRALLRTAPEGSAESSSSGYYCPGSLLRITVDPTQPVAFGMPKDAIAMSTGGQAFEVTLLPELSKGERAVRTVAKYASSNLLASGWVSGEKAVLGKDILLDVRHGKGRVVLFGFRPQFRGQSHGTFKLLLNAVYLGSAKAL
jgi:hypothetical protein